MAVAAMKAIGRIAVKAVKLAGEDGDFASERLFARAGGQNSAAHFSRRTPRRTQPPLGNEQSDFPEADGADRKLSFRSQPDGQFADTAFLMSYCRS